MIKKIIYGVIGAAFLAAVLIYIRAKYLITKIEYGLGSGPSVERIGVKEMKFKLPIWFYNPSNANLIISRLNLHIYFDDYYVSSIDTPGNYMLAAKQHSTYPLTLTVSTGHLLKYLGERGYIINDPKWLEKVDIKIIGTVDVSLGAFSIRNLPIRIGDSLKSYIV